jgi:hypothetical protein
LTFNVTKETCVKPLTIRNDRTLDLFEEITDLLAEALFQDFQAHRRATVQSPQGPHHTKSLTDLSNETKESPHTLHVESRSL